MTQATPYRIFAAVAILVVGCASVRPKPKPILIGIDEQFSLEIPTSACAFKSAQAKLTPQFVVPCLETPAAMLQEVQDAFRSAFAENPACQGGALKTYENASAMTDAVDWRMKLSVRVQDDGSLSIANSSWEIDPHVEGAQSANGVLGDPYQTAAQVCAVVQGRGGTVQ